MNEDGQSRQVFQPLGVDWNLEHALRPQSNDITLTPVDEENPMTEEQVLTLEKEAEQLKSDGKLDEAIDKLKQATEMDDQFVRGHMALSVLYHQVEDHEKSCHHAERVVEIEPEDQFNWSALSVTYQRAFEGTRDPSFIQKAEEAMARSRMS